MNSLTFDWTITAGTIIQVATMVILAIAAYHAIKGQLAIFNNTLSTHAKSLEEHSQKLITVDERIIKIVADLQRLIGRSEVLIDRHRVQNRGGDDGG